MESLSPDVHSDTLGGSSAERRYHCAASYNLEEGMPSLPGSAAASMGTTLHEAAALCIEDDIDAEEIVGWVCEQTGLAVTKDQADNKLRPALEAFYDLLDEHGIENVVLEKTLRAEAIDVPNALGTVDVIGVGSDDSTMLVVDWKFGHYPVTAEFNLQLAFYASAALFEYGSASVDRVTVAILQPDNLGSCVPSVYQFTVNEINKIADRWEENYAKRKSTEPVKGKWCHYCKAKPICSAHVPVPQGTVTVPGPDPNQFTILGDTLPSTDPYAPGKVVGLGIDLPLVINTRSFPTTDGTTAGRDYNLGCITATDITISQGSQNPVDSCDTSDMTINIGEPVTQEPLSPVDYLAALPFDPLVSNEKLGVMLDDWQKILAWVSDRTGYLERLLFGKAEDGEDTPGYKLVEKRNQRTWDDPGKAEAVLKRRLGAANALPRTLITPPQAEKQLGPAVYKKTVAKYVSTRSAGIKLVPEDDSRDSVNVTERFQEVGQMLQDIKEGK